MQVTGFRDPCPWRESDTWYLAVGSGERGKGGSVLLYRSEDLRHWEYLHRLIEGKSNGQTNSNPVDTGEMWECPDFFAVHKKNCLLYSTEGKVIWSTGDYEAQSHRFTAARTGVLDHGAYYAPKSFVASDGRRILWGWIRETRPEAEFSRAGWAGAMSLPRVLSIGAEGQLDMQPAAEVETLRGAVEKISVKPQSPLRRTLDTLRHELLVHIWLFRQITVTVHLNSPGSAPWELVVDVKANTIRWGEISFPLPGPLWPRPDLRLFLDGSIVEAFIGGREAITSRVYGLKPGQTQLEVSVSGDRPVDLEMWPLAAISSNRLTS
jgi:beta-fructofuranosidase